MIKTITVKNHLSEEVAIDLRNPDSSGFFIRSIDGLGPVKATINTSESLSLPGSRFNSARLNSRNVVFNLGFKENPTIEDTRQKSYKYFPLMREIEIEVETDNRTTKTRGYVESNEPDIFSKEEGTIISVVCTDPYLYSLEKTIVEFSNSSSVFEFPFSNESLTQGLIIFGNVLVDPQKTITYLGDFPVGITMRIHAIGDVGTLTVYNLIPSQQMTIYSEILEALTGSGIIAGDDIIITTKKGSKTVTLIRNGVSINILNALGFDTVWFELERGDNIFFYSATSGGSNLQFRIEYDLIYEGI